MTTEAQWQTTVIELAQWYGWRVFHARPAQVRPGVWRTAFTGAAGFPDLVLAKAGQVVFAELKTATGRLTDAQVTWLEELGPNAHVWRPRDLPAVHAVLAGAPC